MGGYIGKREGRLFHAASGHIYSHLYVSALRECSLASLTGVGQAEQQSPIFWNLCMMVN